MAAKQDGECIKEVFNLTVKTQNEPTPSIPKTKLKTCCGICVYKVLATDEVSTEFENDVNTIDQFFPQTITTVTQKLLKFDKTVGDFVEIELLADDSFGTQFPLGVFTDSFTPSNNYVGYQIQWKLVYAAHGEGSYKLRMEFSGLFGDGFMDSDEYCLHKYTPQRANGSVRIEYFLNGILGMNSDDTMRLDYGALNRYNSLRLRGVFSYDKSTYTNDYTLYNNGARPWVKSEQEPEFNLELWPMCFNFHNIMRTDVLQSDNILITDYNSDNVTKWVKKDVQCISEYAPKFFINQSLTAPVIDLKFRQGINNLKKRRS